jgi:aquaporin Z
MATPLHWREYLMEVAGLGLFMVSAAMMSSLLEHPASPVQALVPDPTMRRAAMGVAMGTTAAALIYSPWGRRSGAHNNPAVTLTFFRLGKISGRDALAYVAAQFVGGAAGIAIAAMLLQPWIAHPSVNYVATVPGPHGPAIAFAAEVGISFVMMLVVLIASNHARAARFTGLFAALLVACFITVEAPLSGMSMNPARTLGPDLVAEMFRGVWIYFVAPPLGMLAAAEVVSRMRHRVSIRCAKLYHDSGPCIFGCGARAATEATETAESSHTEAQGSQRAAAVPRWRGRDRAETEITSAFRAS